MKNYIILFKTMLNLNFGISALKFRYTKEKKSLLEPIGIGLSILFGFGSILVMYIFFLLGLFKASLTLNQPEFILAFSFVGAQLVIFLFGIFYMMSAFYFSNDMIMLVPMPLKASTILGAKFTIVVINEYLTALPLLIPPLIIFGAGTGQGIMYWFVGLILILLSPVIPLAFGALFILLLMRFVNLRKSKDLLVVIGSIAGIVIGLGFNIFGRYIGEAATDSGAEFFNRILTSEFGLSEIIGKYFPPSIWAARALSNGGINSFLYFMLFVSVSLALAFLLMKLADLVFLKSLLAGKETYRKKRKPNRDSSELTIVQQKSPLFALLKKESQVFFRTPMYVLNGLSGVVLMPIFLLIPIISDSASFGKMLDDVLNPSNSRYVYVVAYLFILFVIGVNIASSTAISREGGRFWISGLIPVHPSLQTLAKLLLGTMISVMGVVMSSIIFVFLLKFDILRLLSVFVLGVIAGFTTSAMNLLIDLLRPKLVWNSEQEAVKQNLNAFLGMLASWIYSAIIGFAAFMSIAAGASEVLLFIEMFAITIILGAPFVFGVIKLSEDRYRRIMG